ncbi:MAG: aldehyde dehydrogenase family protein [Rhodospirillales bacterium]
MTVKLLIAGDWRQAASGDTIAVIDPSDGQEYARIGRGGAEDVDRAVKAARAAMDGAWGRMAAVERGRLLAKLGQAIGERTEELARIEARDCGKPLKQARADAAACARYFEFYAGAADKLHGETIPYLQGYTVMTLREPHGVTGHIIPWNYPMQILGRSVAAALAAGNACVLKPAEDASMSSLRIGELATELGFPPGAINVVPGLGEEAGAALSAHPGVDHLSFTGSPEVGTLVQQAAARNNVPVTMELGGKSPQLVFADADLDAALPFITGAIIQNAGQTCSAGSRLLIEQSAFERVAEAVAARFRALRAGPWDMDLDCGPLINRQQKTRVDGYIGRALNDGVVKLAEGAIAPNTPPGGYYVAPSFFGPVRPESRLGQEEVFGPVLAAIRFADEDEAVRIANGTPYGLVASVWTRDGGRQLRMARALKCGQVFVNNYGAGGGVELPFGGVKRSGFGREKGFEALYGFTALKTVAIRHG